MTNIKLAKLIETETHKIFRSKSYNFNFDKRNGLFLRWGETIDDDPIMAPSNEILDIEISTVCNKSCKFCYKGNSVDQSGENMSFETYRKILDKFPKTKDGVFFLQQVALGIGAVDGNPDLFNIMHHTREQGVIPNITVNGKDISDQHIKDLANVCGAIAVSHYNNKDCFSTINRLAEAKRSDSSTLQQINIHKLFSTETYDSCVDLINTISEDDELMKNLNAVVFLSVKPCGPKNTYTPVDNVECIKNLLSMAQEKGISVGCDSCSAPGVLRWANDTNQNQVIQSIECCEACLTSFYVSVDGIAYPCSFAEQHTKWGALKTNMLEVEDFTHDVWLSPKIMEWRKALLNSSSECIDCQVQKHCRSCPIYDITPCKSYQKLSLKIL